MSRESTGSTIAALLLGAAAGFVAGLLLAPASGAATRDAVRQRASETFSRAGGGLLESAQGITASAGHWVERAQGGLGSAWETARSRLGRREEGTGEASAEHDGDDLPGAPDESPEPGGSF
ncbi:MAG: hypothetical protein QJR14_04040 [Bacillota bacterium]|nr:hypothetical protein [Bacillota bacterium]